LSLLDKIKGGTVEIAANQILMRAPTSENTTVLNKAPKISAPDAPKPALEYSTDTPTPITSAKQNGKPCGIDFILVRGALLDGRTLFSHKKLWTNQPDSSQPSFRWQASPLRKAASGQGAWLEPAESGLAEAEGEAGDEEQE
jgi:hypothetical protein